MATARSSACALSRHAASNASGSAETQGWSSHARSTWKRSAGEAQGYPTLEALAAEWGWSARTLMRRLQREGTRYQALLDEARQRAALWYLRHSTRPVEEIALQLGYADASNFSRTCRRRNGAPPQALRTAPPGPET